MPILTRRDLNQYSRYIEKTPVFVDFEKGLITTNVRVPTLHGEIEITLNYALKVLNETGLSVRNEFIHKQVKDYLRGRLEF